ncbi:MAG TPA: TRAP transporter substrate-binding protein DctP, partial [Patescibacteria group bacterium]|nr:TRAP transporter substrate-binding protein DctP [Patescibacteria group bacterium]
MDEIERRTNGSVKFKRHYAGALTKGMETLPALRSGAVDVCDPPPGYFSDELPLLGLTNVVRVSRDAPTLMNAISHLLFDEGKIAEILQNEIRKQNFIYLFPHSMDYTMLTRKPVYKLSDLKGMRMRSVGQYEPRQKARWGVISVNVLPAELYEAISRGTVDGMSYCRNQIPFYKLHEVAKWVSFDDGVISGVPMSMNLDTWNKLPSDVQNLILGMRKEAVEYDLGAWLKQKYDTMATLRDQGCNLVQVEPKEQEEVFNSWIEVALDVWLPFVEKKGLKTEGRLVLDRWLELNTEKGLNFWE